jgi:DNA invertase Pin-like site-specific DNA recombinase
MKAAIYARVSTTDKGQTNENQIQVLRTMAEARGWEIVAVYSDTVSGAKVNVDKRKEFPKMMEAARRGEFGVLMVFSIDRLTRKGGFAAIDIVRQLSEYGVKVASYVQQYLDPASPFYATLLALAGDLAAMERNTFVERVHAGLKRARKEGRIGGRRKLVIDREKIRTRYAAGESQPVIAADLGVSVMTVNRIVRAAA